MPQHSFEADYGDFFLRGRNDFSYFAQNSKINPEFLASPECFFDIIVVFVLESFCGVLDSILIPCPRNEDGVEKSWLVGWSAQVWHRQ